MVSNTTDMPKSTCLITGASGFLGRAVARRIARDRPTTPVGFRQVADGITACDLRDPAAVARLIQATNPGAVIHLAAYRDPDFCEGYPADAEALNVGATRAICEATPAGVPVLFASSDYVFDGLRPPYDETSITSPISVYGRTKVASEEWVLAREGGMALRFPLLTGAGEDLASSGIIGRMAAMVRDPTPADVDDVAIRFPTWIEDVAEAFAWCLERGIDGIVHVSGLRGVTRYGMTREVAEALGAPAEHLRPTTVQAPQRAPRPPNSQLAPARLRSMGYERFTDFRDVIRDVLTRFDLP